MSFFFISSGGSLTIGGGTGDGTGGGHIIGSSDDGLVGTEFADQIRGGEGRDTLDGLGGNDTLEGNESADDLYGGPGRDRILGGYGQDFIDGGADADSIIASFGPDTALGGEGDDSIEGNKGDDLLDGEAGRDTLDSGEGDDSLRGGSGNDSLIGGEGTDTALYDERAEAAEISRTGPDTLIVALEDGSTDRLTGIETILFADATFRAGAASEAEAFVVRLYDAVFGRIPDRGLDHWAAQIEAGMSEDAVARAFMGSAEYEALYGSAAGPEALIDALYAHVLGREADEAGRAHWLGRIEAGMRPEAVLLGFTESEENVAAHAETLDAGLLFV